MVACLAVVGCADDSRATGSSWDARPVASSPAEQAPPAAAITWAENSAPSATRVPGGQVPRAQVPRAQGRGPLPIDRRSTVVVEPAEPPDGFPVAPAVLSAPPIVAAPYCPSYGNEAAAILTEQVFPVESARLTGGYQVSDGGTMVSIWRQTPLVVLGLQGRPVYCAATRTGEGYQIPAGRRICFADPDGDLLFDRVFVVQAEPKSFGTAPVRYAINPLEARRRPGPECFVPG